MDTQKYKKLFLIEADEKIIALNRALIQLEKNPTDSGYANDAMRAAHTLKSSASAMNYMGISHLAHAMEDLFSYSHGEHSGSQKKELSSDAIQLLFETVDTLNLALQRIKKAQEPPDMSQALERLHRVYSSQKRKQSQEDTKIQAQEDTSLQPSSYKLNTILDPVEAIKVDVLVLDRLMDLTEELLVERMRFSQIVSSVETLMSKNIDNGAIEANDLTEKSDSVTALKSSSENFNRLLSALQFNVVQARMVPLGQIFERFPRMVRDIAVEQKKEVRLEMQGQDIELDRTIIDRLGEPLIHLLRNAVDHGIENSGSILLSAERERDKVLIKVENTGNVIDWQKVVEVAFNRGIIDNIIRDKYFEQLRNSNIVKHNSDIENLLYIGELSTSDKVTEVSGRGIGMSIVKSVIESLGGKVLIDGFAPQRGTRIILELPLTLAIIQALLVRVHDHIFALPFSQIDKSVRVPMRNIKKAFDQEVAVVDEEDIPMVRLDSVFGLRKNSGVFLSEAEIQDKSRQLKQSLKAELIVITKKENSSFVGLVIDEMIAEQDIVVKPFKGALKRSKGFAGVTLLGDGSPALILDVATLI